MAKLANISVGGRNPVRIMGILNTSPESFYKKSINTTRMKIRNTVVQMENEGADFIDVGGMSTAPYLATTVSEKTESKRIIDAIKIIQPKVGKLALLLSKNAVKYKALPAVGRTHGQHASIISFGLKFANWASEMATHLERLDEIKKRILICKTLGVVGTGSLMGKDAVRVQELVAKKLSLFPAKVTTQIIPRERYAEYIFQLSLLGATLEKISIEIRNLQRTEIGEVSEYFKKGQMGSSAVPVKRNPIKSERISSLSKLLRSQINTSFENIPLWHERDLSNSATAEFIAAVSSAGAFQLTVIRSLTSNPIFLRSS